MQDSIVVFVQSLNGNIIVISSCAHVQSQRQQRLLLSSTWVICIHDMHHSIDYIFMTDRLPFVCLILHQQSSSRLIWLRFWIACDRRMLRPTSPTTTSEEAVTTAAETSGTIRFSKNKFPRGWTSGIVNFPIQRCWWVRDVGRDMGTSGQRDFWTSGHLHTALKINNLIGSSRNRLEGNRFDFFQIKFLPPSWRKCTNYTRDFPVGLIAMSRFF